MKEQIFLLQIMKKYSNALKYNIPIITEQEFKEIIKEATYNAE